MNCIFTEKVSEWIDGELPPGVSRDVERHLLECHECQQVRADFMSLRREISSCALRPDEAMPPRLARLVSPSGFSSHQPWPSRLVSALVPRGLHPALVTGAAVLLIACGLWLVLKTRSTRPDSAPPSFAQNPPARSPTVNQLNSSAENNVDSQRRGQGPDNAIKAPVTLNPKPGTVAVVNVNNQNSRRSGKSNTGELVAQSDKAEYEGPNTNVIDAPTGSVDSETLTARHVEQSELLLRSFRNLRPGSNGAADDLGYERRRAQQLFYQNVMLRREADSAGDVQVATLLESLEPILLDIANLPQRSPGSEVRAIKDRVERQNLVALLQINSKN